MHLTVITLCIVFPFDFVCCYKIRDFWFPPWCLLTFFRTSQHQKEVVALKSQLKSYKRRLKVKASTLSEFYRLCNGAKLRGADLSLKWSVTFRIGVHTICFSCRNEKVSAGLCCSRARWPLAPNVCSRATRKSQIFHTNHMLGALDFIGSEHWSSFDVP